MRDTDPASTAVTAGPPAGLSPQPAQEWTVYDARPALARPAALLGEIARDAWRGRELAWRLFLRNLRGMYRQTLLGLFWIILPPLANTMIWIFLRSRNVFTFSDSLAVDPAVYILAGMILWQSFFEAFQMPLETLERNRGMISKLNFPREALLLEGLGDLLFQLSIRFALLIPVAWLLGSPLAPLGLAAAVPVALLLVLVGLATGLLIAPFGSLYHDVGRFISVAGPFWMIITPVIYAVAPVWPQNLLVWLNPAAPLLVTARDLLFGAGPAHAWAALVWGLLLLPLLVAGLVIWRVSIPALVERMTS